MCVCLRDYVEHQAGSPQLLVAYSNFKCLKSQWTGTPYCKLSIQHYSMNSLVQNAHLEKNHVRCVHSFFFIVTTLG